MSLLSLVLHCVEILQDGFEAGVDREPPNRENLPVRVSAFEVSSVFPSSWLNEDVVARHGTVQGWWGGSGAVAQV